MLGHPKAAGHGRRQRRNHAGPLVIVICTRRGRYMLESARPPKVTEMTSVCMPTGELRNLSAPTLSPSSPTRMSVVGLPWLYVLLVE